MKKIKVLLGLVSAFLLGNVHETQAQEVLYFGAEIKNTTSVQKYVTVTFSSSVELYFNQNWNSDEVTEHIKSKLSVNIPENKFIHIADSLTRKWGSLQERNIHMLEKVDDVEDVSEFLLDPQQIKTWGTGFREGFFDNSNTVHTLTDAFMMYLKPDAEEVIFNPVLNLKIDDDYPGYTGGNEFCGSFPFTMDMRGKRAGIEINNGGAALLSYQ